ncbi:myosin-6-like [Bombina bombina]|uniref:myosin-6-like n=1 Tax=Bombina bombina TaxID=8345 RepID=UPI00235B1873|nr:myosin-6-like [Bombina bombina]
MASTVPETQEANSCILSSQKQEKLLGCAEQNTQILEVNHHLEIKVETSESSEQLRDPTSTSEAKILNSKEVAEEPNTLTSKGEQAAEENRRNLTQDFEKEDEIVIKILLQDDIEHQETLKTPSQEDTILDSSKVNVTEEKAELDKMTFEKRDSNEKQKGNLEEVIKKKDLEISSLGMKLEEERLLTMELQRKNKEYLVHIEELEDELEAEKCIRAKSDFVLQVVLIDKGRQC